MPRSRVLLLFLFTLSQSAGFAREAPGWGGLPGGGAAPREAAAVDLPVELRFGLTVENGFEEGTDADVWAGARLEMFRTSAPGGGRELRLVEPVDHPWKMFFGDLAWPAPNVFAVQSVMFVPDGESGAYHDFHQTRLALREYARDMFWGWRRTPRGQGERAKAGEFGADLVEAYGTWVLGPPAAGFNLALTGRGSVGPVENRISGTWNRQGSWEEAARTRWGSRDERRGLRVPAGKWRYGQEKPERPAETYLLLEAAVGLLQLPVLPVGKVKEHRYRLAVPGVGGKAAAVLGRIGKDMPPPKPRAATRLVSFRVLRDDARYLEAVGTSVARNRSDGWCTVRDREDGDALYWIRFTRAFRFDKQREVMEMDGVFLEFQVAPDRDDADEVNMKVRMVIAHAPEGARFARLVEGLGERGAALDRYPLQPGLVDKLERKYGAAEFPWRAEREDS